MGIFDKFFGGGGAEVDVDQLKEIAQMEQELNRKNLYGLFSGWEYKQGEDGTWGQHQTLNPALQGGMDSLMSRMSSPSESYSSPSQLNQLLDARMANQFDRSGLTGGNAPDPSQYGPSSASQMQPQQGPGQQMMPGGNQMPAQPQGPQGPQGPGGGIGGMFGPGGGADAGMNDRRDMAQQGGFMSKMFGGGQPRPGMMDQIKGNYEPGQGAGTPMQNLSRALQGRPELEGADESPFSKMMGMFG